MGRRCCITGCTSTSRLPEHHGVTYHSFPLDTTIRSIWLRNAKLSAERNITKSVLVCSRHFRRVDFQPQRSGKYLLKQRVFPTVFPWGRVDNEQIEADAAALNLNGGISGASGGLNTHLASNVEDATKATVEATVAQIMAETAELNASAIKIEEGTGSEDGEAASNSAVDLDSPSVGAKYEQVALFHQGVRLEAQDFDGGWHVARIVEVDNDDREVLIKFEKSGKNKSTVVGTEEWIPMNSTRLRQKVSSKVLPVFTLEEKCMARWSGPRKFPGTIKKILGNDTYEVLFDDGYVKNVRAVHMNKLLSAAETAAVATTNTVVADVPNVSTAAASPQWTPPKISNPVTPALGAKPKSSSNSTSSKKRTSLRKDWPLLDMSKLDLTSLNLPEIPHDGEWTCHWVNDQPIGVDGFLIVGEHRKPTVIVDDWRLPPGWIKHMYQRSNVLGKWDVILVTPSGKRFRSKADLKVFLEEQGQVYNPDIYDFSIHRRRAKDINAYVFTSDYTPQVSHKPKTPVESAAATTSAGTSNATPNNTLSSTLNSSNGSQFMETPVATAIPPMELMTQSSPVNVPALETSATVHGTAAEVGPAVGNGFAYIGGLKVEIIDNLFRCPKEGCSKNFRKENHVQIHVKHYHHDIAKLLGVCPKMMELAEKRTHPVQNDSIEPLPKNQISNQQFFAKMHQQDLEYARAHRKAGSAAIASSTSGIETNLKNVVELEKMEVEPDIMSLSAVNISGVSLGNTTASTSILEHSLVSTTADNSSLANVRAIAAPKRARYSSPNKRSSGARKSNRQRTTRHYLTAPNARGAMQSTMLAGENSFGVTDFEETRHSFNTTPDVKIVDAIKRRVIGAPATPLSSMDSPATADSGSSSYQALLTPANEADATGGVLEKPQYIKENGELIKIVRMRQEEIINCLCSYGEEDGLMIQCELCLCWQHGICNGIDKESDVPDKYVCFICRNPQRARESMRFKHDQDWMYEGKLPVANYHTPNPDLPKRCEILKKSHSLTGNLIELKNYMHSLRVKINIANNRCHPKLYLWAKKWDEEQAQNVHVKVEPDIKTELDMTVGDGKEKDLTVSPNKRIKVELVNKLTQPVPNIPQPEAAIDPVECQQRLVEHIKVQHNLVMNRLNRIETEIDSLESQDDLPDLQEADLSQTKDILATFIKEVDILKQIAKLNALEHTKEAMKRPQTNNSRF